MSVCLSVCEQHCANSRAYSIDFHESSSGYGSLLGENNVLGYVVGLAQNGEIATTLDLCYSGYYNTNRDYA